MKLLDKNVTVFPYILSGWLQILVKDPSVVPAAAGCSDLALTWPRRCWRLAAPSAMLFGKLNIIYIFNDITSPCPCPPPHSPCFARLTDQWKLQKWVEMWAKLKWDLSQIFVSCSVLEDQLWWPLCFSPCVITRARLTPAKQIQIVAGPGCRPPVSPRTLLLQIEFKLVKVPGWGWWLVLCGLNKHLAIRTHIKIVSSLRTDKHNLGWWWGRVI